MDRWLGNFLISAFGIGVCTYLAVRFQLESRKYRELIRRSRNQETDRIDDLHSKKNGSLIEIHAPLSDTEGLFSPITQRPCAWWSCKVYKAYLRQNGRYISGGERQIAELSSGNTWIFAKDNENRLAIDLTSAEILPECSFSHSAIFGQSLPEPLLKFVETKLKDHLEKSREYHADIERLRFKPGDINICFRYVEFILPLDASIYAIGKLGHLSSPPDPITYQNPCTSEKLLPLALSSKETIICATGENAMIATLRRRSRFELLMSVMVILFGIGLFLALWDNVQSP